MKRAADAFDLPHVRRYVHVRPIVLRHHVYVAFGIGRVPMAGERLAQAGVDGDHVLPVGRHVEGIDHVNLLVELAVHQAVHRYEASVAPGFQLVLRERFLQLLQLRARQVRVVLPAHRKAPHLGIGELVQVNAVVHPCEPPEGRHGAEDAAARIERAHDAFKVNVLRRLLVEPDEILAGALELFAPLRAGLEAYRGHPAVHALDLDGVDHAVLQIVRAALAHAHAPDPRGIDVTEQLLLRHIPLHLAGQAHHPAVHGPVHRQIRVVPPGEIRAFRRARLRLARSVAAQQPLVPLGAAMKQRLALVRTVVFQPVLAPPAPVFAREALGLPQQPLAADAALPNAFRCVTPPFSREGGTAPRAIPLRLFRLRSLLNPAYTV